MLLLVAAGLFLWMRSNSGPTHSSTHQENATHTTTSSDHVTELAAREAKDRYIALCGGDVTTSLKG